MQHPPIHQLRHPIPKSRPLIAAAFAAHALIVSVGVISAIILFPSLPPAISRIVAAVAALHAGVSVGVHVLMGVSATGLLLAILRFHALGRSHSSAHGATLHSPRFYDWMAAAYCVGREGRMRERTLDVAGVTAGDRVLDVCCGTGTLALAAQRRVGAAGAAYGVDASGEMIARARAKASRQGLPVEFEIAAAQSLPFADASFDVVLCTLALHHLPDESREQAIDEMRRVLKPGGQVLIVEISRGRGAWELLHPVALLHRRKSPILDEALALLHRPGLEAPVTGPLGFAGLGYTLARRV
jgi:ubiquinone/menaquinone biosynthesis C-methylase UbiE